MRQTIFISYSWANTNLADKIDTAFAPTGLLIKRDVREIGYKGSIKDYMKQVRSTDYVLLIVSDSFLKSANAMYEVLELLKDSNFKSKILPIIIADTKIYKPEDRLEYIKYWKDKHSELELKLESVNTTDAIELYKDLKHYENIRTSIDEFLGILNDMNSPTFSELEKENFQKVFTYLGVSDRVLINEILSIRELASDDEKDIEMDKLEAKYPNNSKIYLTKGIYAYQRNQIVKSSYFYRKSLALDPSFGGTYYNLGYNVEVYDKNFDEAKTLYEKSIELEPSNTRAYTNLAGLYSLHYKKPKQAMELLEKALDINPFEATVHFNLALTLHRDFEEWDKAKYHYEFAIQIKKDFNDAKHNYGLLLSSHFEKHADAKDLFLEVLEAEPNSKKTLQALAELLEDKYKHYTTAKVYYDRQMKIEPFEAKEHYFYSTFLMLHFLPQHKELARKHYDIACAMDNSFVSDAAEVLLK